MFRISKTCGAVVVVLFSLLIGHVEAQNYPLWKNAPLENSPITKAGANSSAAPVKKITAPVAGPKTRLVAKAAALTVPQSISAEITSLAASLGDGQAVSGEAASAKALRIYNWVRNTIDYQHYHGLVKGSALTLLEGSGNDFDQSALLRDLLVAAGYSASNVKLVRLSNFISYNDLRDWIGLADEPFPGKTHDQAFSYPSPYGAGITDKTAKQISFAGNFLISLGSGTVLDSSGLPQYSIDQGNASMLFDRILVAVSFDGGGTYSFFDPSFKRYSKGGVVNLASASGYSRPAILAAASGTGDANSVFGMNGTATGTYLAARAAALIPSHGSSSMKDLIAGKSIVPSVATTVEQACQQPNALSHTYFDSVDAPDFASYKSKVRFSSTAASGLDYTIPISDLKGRKITLTFNGNNAELRLDDDTIADTGALGTATKMDLTISVTHPGRGAGNQSETKNYLKQTSAAEPCSYAIIYGFDASERLLTKRQEQLKAYKDANKPDDSREVRTEILNIMGLTWLNQTAMANRLIASQNRVIPLFYHRFGRMAQEAGFYVDVGLQYSGNMPDDGVRDDGRNDNLFHLGSLFASAFEHGVIQQLQAKADGSPYDAVSTVNILREANKGVAGQKLLLARSSNWTNTIKPLLVGAAYTNLNGVPDLGEFTDANGNGIRDSNEPWTDKPVRDNLEWLVLSNQAQLFLPLNGNVTQGIWNGSGWVIRAPTIAGMIISGGYSGGYATTLGKVASPVIATSFSYNPISTYKPPSVPVIPYTPPVTTPKFYAADPVDMSSGAFVYGSEDMATGTEGVPRGLAFSRSYSSNLASRDEQNLGFGWTHNFHIRAESRTASDEALGMGSPQQAAAFLAAVIAASDLYRTDASPKEWGVATLAVGWFVDQMRNNAVSVRMGKEVFQFLKQPDGTFTPPPGSTLALTKAADGTYRLRQRLGNTIEFDTAGKASRIIDIDAKPLIFAYNANNTINYVEDCFARRYTFGYNGTHIISVTDSTSPTRSISFGYDAANWNLTKATDPEGKVSYFDYSVPGDPGNTTPDQHRIVRLRNHDNETITQNVWDSLGRVERQLLHGDTSKTFRLYYSGRDNIEVNPQGGITHYYYDERGRATGTRDPEGNLTSVAYDGQDHVVSRTSATGEVTGYTFDANHNITRIDHPRGGGSTIMTYDILNRLDRVTDPNGIQTHYGYFANTNDAGKDRPQVVIEAYGTPDQSTTTYAYFQSGPAFGRVQSVTDGDGLVTTKNYDSYGQPDITTRPGGFTINENYSARGNLDSVVDANGKTTSYTYNQRRQATGETADTGGVAASTISTFDNQARLATLTPPENNGGLRPQESRTYNATDKIRLQRLNGVVISDTSYDSRDWVSTTRDAANRTTTFVRKANGSLSETQRPGSRISTFLYDGDSRLKSNTNPGSNSGSRNDTYSYTTTPGGLPRTLKTEADGLAVTSDYDAKGQLRFLKDRKGGTFEFRYDALGRRTRVITPQGQATVTSYKKNGRIATVTEPSGDSATFSYNPTSGRLAGVTYSGAGGGTVNYTGYDSNGNLLSLNEGGNGTITRTYDGLNRVTSYTFAGQTIGYRYYPSGKLAKLIYPGGSETGTGHVEYTYNADGRLYQVIDRLDSVTTPRTTTYQWNADGRLASISRPNGTTRLINYDGAGRPAGIFESAGLAWTMSYWGSDEIKSLDVIPAIPSSQLAAVPAGTMTFDSANQLATYNGQAVTHDLDGNMITGPIPRTGAMGNYTYDSRNRLTSAGGLTYTYNAEGNRVGIGGNETTSLVVDPEGALPKVLIRTKNGVTTRYVYGAGLQYEVNAAGQATYYHYDQTGNTAGLSNQAGALIERIAYSPYGTVRYRQSNFDTPFLYGGFFGVMSDTNGLINMRARYYNPLTMRFINSDPARDGLNWYAYANGNPVGFVDPTGMGAEKVLNAVQGGLTVLGFVPGAGAVADILNAGISLARGDYVGAGFNLASAVPGIGDTFAAGKIATAAVGMAVAKSSVKAVTSTAVTAAKVERAAVKVEEVATRTTMTLPADIAATFRGGNYGSRVLQSDVEVFRFSGGISAPEGRFLTTRQTVRGIATPSEAISALNLPPGATATQLNNFIIPKGTRIFYGRVEGGGATATQIFIDNSSVLRAAP